MESCGIEEETKLSEGAALGALFGGAAVVLIVGLTAVGIVATGGMGLLASGPLVAALAGAGATLGTVIGAAIPEHEVKYSEDAIKKGSVLVGVKYNSDNEDLIKDVLKANDTDKIATA